MSTPTTSVPASPTADQALALVEAVASGNTQSLHEAVTALLHEVFSPQISEALAARATAAADTVAGDVQSEIARLRAELAKLEGGN